MRDVRGSIQPPKGVLRRASRRRLAYARMWGVGLSGTRGPEARQSITYWTLRRTRIAPDRLRFIFGIQGSLERPQGLERGLRPRARRPQKAPIRSPSNVASLTTEWVSGLCVAR